MVTNCPACKGRGTVVTDSCDDCRGRGRMSVERRLSVRVPAGIHDGQAVRLQGEGEPPPVEVDPSGSAGRGDLHVVCRAESHEQFERDGDDLIVALPVSFAQLAMGAKVPVPLLDPDELEDHVDVPGGTQHGSIFRIEGRGIPGLRTGRRGDLIAVLQIIVPSKLDDEQRELLERYAETEDIEINATNPSFWNRIKDAVTGRG